MKSFIVILSLVIGVSAQAALKVGDSAHYAMDMGGETFDLLNEVTAVNAAAGKFTVKETIIADGSVVQQQSTDESIDENTQNESFFDACMQLPTEVNARYESVTVPAGKFNTCHIIGTNEEGAQVDLYFGKVVFGIVKAVVTNTTDSSANVTMELKSFKKN